MLNLKKIVSSDNKHIKFLKKLGQKKYRQESGKFLVENFVIIHDALKSGFDYEMLFVSEDFAEKYPEKIKYLFEKSQTQENYLISNKLNKNFSGLDNPSGIAAVYPFKQKKIDISAPAVYLNGINDQGNIGTIMRSALAFGYENVIVDNACADVFNAKTVSAAKDAIFKLNVYQDFDGSWLEKNKNDYFIIAADAKNGKDPDDIIPERQICLILGSESRGISPGLIGLADEKVKIKISGKIESLNVASAAAILFYALQK